MKYGNELKVGLAIIGAIVVFVLGFRFFMDLPLFDRTYELRTRLPEAEGLVPGNPVRINGVRVGSVRGVALSPTQDAVDVRFRVDEGVAVPQGSTARISGIGALGGVQLSIDPGPSTNPPIAAGGLVPAGPQNDLLGDLSARAPGLARRVDSLLLNADAAMQAARRTFDDAGTLIGDSRGDLRQTLASFRQSSQALSRALNAQEGRLEGVLAGAAATTANTAALTGDLQRALGGSNADTLGTAVHRLSSAMRRLDTSLVTLNTSLTTLDTAATDLRAITARVERGEGTLGRLATDDSLYVRLDSAATRLSALLEDFQRNPGRYLEELTLVDIF